jgi:HEAT repeat protein
MKRICVCAAGILFFGTAVISNLAAQEPELSVEDSYLQESVEVMIITAQSNSDDRNEKMLALDYIGDLLERGNAPGADIVNVLVDLALEGIVNRTMTGGSVSNNFPEVRVRAVEYLGKVGTERAKAAVIRVCDAEKEPMVLTEAINSLAKINAGSNADSLNKIYEVFTHFDVHFPDNRLTLAVLNAYEGFIKRGEASRDPRIISTVMYISTNPTYIYPVRHKATQLLNAFRLTNFNIQGK